MDPQVRYHQMLVSPHVGGGAKLAMEIHAYVVTNRGPISQLLLPGGGEAKRTAEQARFPFTEYRVDRLTGPGRISSIVENFRLYAKTARHGLGVIHVHAPFVYAAAQSFFSVCRLKTVLHIHLDFSVEQLRWALRTPPDLVVICANFMRTAVEQAIGEKGSARTNIKVMRNAVDLRRFRSTDRRAAKVSLGVRDDIPLLMMVANLAPHKGQETAMRAVAALKGRGHKVRLWLVGSERSEGQGHLRYLQELCKRLGIGDQVDFIGFRNDIPELLGAADFVLLPSTSEGLPLVILEAQASKAVVLAAPTAGVPEVIENGRTGFLIDAKDHDAYAARIACLLTNPDEVQAVKDAAYRHVHDHHDIDSYCRRVLQEYDELLLAR